MVYLLTWIVGFLLGASLGFHLGFYLKQLLNKVREIYERDPEPTPQVVTPLGPGYADVNELSSIVTPKTPEQIEREEQARIRNL